MPTDPKLTAYAEHTEATPADLTRLRARIQAAHVAPMRSLRPLLLGGAVLAFAGLLAVVATEPAPEPIAATFDDLGTATATEVAPGVIVTADGIGELSGTEQAPVLAWSAGTIEVSVEPGAGLDVRVTTDEALVHVVGTVFEVNRGPLGTRVEVTRGQVAVTCTDGTAHNLSADRSATCLPGSATGLLGRAQALRTHRGSAEAILETIDRGLNTESTPTIFTELSALQVSVLAEGPDTTAAIDAAARHLADPATGRRAAVARIGATLGYTASGCSGAEPFIAEIPPEEVSASALSMCNTPGGAAKPR
jgi:hypothetical protein